MQRADKDKHYICWWSGLLLSCFVLNLCSSVKWWNSHTSNCEPQYMVVPSNLMKSYHLYCNVIQSRVKVSIHLCHFVCKNLCGRRSLMVRECSVIRELRGDLIWLLQPVGAAGPRNKESQWFPKFQLCLFMWDVFIYYCIIIILTVCIVQ